MSDRGPLRRRLVMTTQNFTTTVLVDATPDQVFDAIANVRAWWSEEIDGDTDRLGATFEFHYKDLHRSTHRISEFVRGERIVWQTVTAQINFVADPTEWNGTEVVFDIARRGDRTELRFTHVGLVPAIQCYGDCSGAWGYHLESLKDLITTGSGRPNRAGDA
jgi:uncharacterized protein YndB with AHSA1/START domain